MKISTISRRDNGSENQPSPSNGENNLKLKEICNVFNKAARKPNDQPNIENANNQCGRREGENSPSNNEKKIMSYSQYIEKPRRRRKKGKPINNEGQKEKAMKMKENSNIITLNM